ncbi:chaperone protein DnaK [Bifidobacterium bifidum]|nr:chaperone protein DnaK [Bifidobacterium bifidum]
MTWTHGQRRQHLSHTHKMRPPIPRPAKLSNPPRLLPQTWVPRLRILLPQRHPLTRGTSLLRLRRKLRVYQGEREFARDNKPLGTFELTGIAPAPRGVPQIEVTFDIDANGIVHVSAKDKGTGKEQSMTITGGSGLPKDEIDRMVKEAEAHEAEDKQRKEDAETRNQAEAFAYSTEKLVNDNKDKLSDDIVKEVTDKVNALKEALKGDDTDKVKTAQGELMTSAQKIGQVLYAQQGAEGAAAGAGAAGASAGSASGSDDDTVEAEVVDDDDDKDNK